MSKSDQQLGDALLKLSLSNTAATPDPQLERIMASERRRIKWLTRAAVGLWVLVVVLAAALYIIAGLVLPLIARALEQAGKANIDAAETPLLMVAKLTAANIIVCSVSLAVLSAAGLVTVLLVFASRRATLRQINSNLLEISEQLKLMRQSPQKSP